MWQVGAWQGNHQEMGPNWTLVERLSDLHLGKWVWQVAGGGVAGVHVRILLLPVVERILEDHEKVLDCIKHWPRAHSNNILFKNNPEKYYIIKRPQLLMPSSHAYSSVNPQRTTFSEQQKKKIILKVFVGR